MSILHLGSNISEDLLLNICSYDHLSPIYLTNKQYYKKGSEIHNNIAIKIQRWYRSKMMKNFTPSMMWKYKGLLIRLFLALYSNQCERFMLSLPHSIVDKFKNVNYIQEQEIKDGLADAYRVFKESRGRKSDVLRFLYNNKLTIEYYRIYGI